MKTVKLVATVLTVKALLPAQYAARYADNLKHSPGWTPPGPISADFLVDPSACRTKFGCWLAETVSTTRFDDDFSLLHLTMRATEEDLHVREAFKNLGGRSLRSVRDFERFQTQVVTWLDKRRGVVRMYGECCFQPRVIKFQWPVFGGAHASQAATPEEYFDLCAAHIRALMPTRVKHCASEAEPPASLRVDGG